MFWENGAEHTGSVMADTGQTNYVMAWHILIWPGTYFYVKKYSGMARQIILGPDLWSDTFLNGNIYSVMARYIMIINGIARHGMHARSVLV